MTGMTPLASTVAKFVAFVTDCDTIRFKGKDAAAHRRRFDGLFANLTFALAAEDAEASASTVTDPPPDAARRLVDEPKGVQDVVNAALAATADLQGGGDVGFDAPWAWGTTETPSDDSRYTGPVYETLLEQAKETLHRERWYENADGIPMPDDRQDTHTVAKRTFDALHPDDGIDYRCDNPVTEAICRMLRIDPNKLARITIDTNDEDFTVHVTWVASDVVNIPVPAVTNYRLVPVSAEEPVLPADVIKERLERIEFDPTFPGQACVEVDGYDVWLHTAAQLARYMKGHTCNCMNASADQCKIHGYR